MPAAGPWPVSCAGRAAFSAADAGKRSVIDVLKLRSGYHKAAYPYVCKADPADPFCDIDRRRLFLTEIHSAVREMLHCREKRRKSL